MLWNKVLRGTTILAFLSFLCGAEAAAATRLALVIGNGDYSTPLVTSRQDARDVAATLRNLEFEVIHLEDRKLKDMQRALQELASKADGADTLLFYFAGHGVQVNGSNYLVPAKAGFSRVEEVPLATLALDDVFAVFWESEALSKIVILDACRNNPFADPGDASEGQWVPGLAKPANAPPGTLTLFATDPGETALDGRSKHSPFTAALLHFITEPGLELRDLFTEVRNAVIAVTSGLQTPWEDGAPTARTFYFRAPAAIRGEILEGDDEVLVLVNGEEAMSLNSGTTAKTIPLKAGENRVVIKVFNQSTYRGACNWFRQTYEDLRPFLEGIGVQLEEIQNPEGWRYKVRFLSGQDPNPLHVFKGDEDVPEMKGPRHGKMFTVAEARILVDRVTGKVTIENAKEVWRD